MLYEWVSISRVYACTVCRLYTVQCGWEMACVYATSCTCAQMIYRLDEYDRVGLSFLVVCVMYMLVSIRVCI